MLARPTHIEVIDAFHQHLAQSAIHSVTSKELADAEHWNLTAVSSALNEAFAKGTLVREHGAFRPATNQKGKPITNPELPAKPEPKPAQPVGERWPEDEEFIARYEPALRSPDGPRAALRAEFRRPYGTIGYHATAVYRRLGIEKPTARGFRHPPVDKEAWPSDPEFVQRYEPTLKTTSDVRGALEDEFNRPYRSINEHAKAVYARLKLPRPCGKRGWPTPPPKVAKSAPVAEVTVSQGYVPVDPVANTLAATVWLSSEQIEMFFADEEPEAKPFTYEDLLVPKDEFDRFCAKFDATQQPQETPATLDGPDPWDSPSVAPGEPEGGNHEVLGIKAWKVGQTQAESIANLSEEANEAAAMAEVKREDRECLAGLIARVDELNTENAQLKNRYNAKSEALNTEQIESARMFAKLEEARDDNVRLIEKANDAFFKVDELTAENAELRIRINEKEETLKDVGQGNCDLWAKLRQADADLTKRDEGIRSLEESAATLTAVVDHDKIARQRMEDRMAMQLRTISNLQAQIAQAEAKPPQAITLTLTIPAEFLRLGVAG